MRSFLGEMTTKDGKITSDDALNKSTPPPPNDRLPLAIGRPTAPTERCRESRVSHMVIGLCCVQLLALSFYEAAAPPSYVAQYQNPMVRSLHHTGR